MQDRYNGTYGGIFQDNPISIAAIEAPAGLMFCADGGQSPKTAWDPEQIVTQYGGLALDSTTNPKYVYAVGGYPQGALFGRHTNGLNNVFFDGHAKFLRLTELIKSTYDSSANACIYPYFSIKDVSGYPACGAGQNPLQ